MGTLIPSLLERADGLRAASPTTPTVINMDGTHKPENYYTYGQMADVLQVDPYYQKRLLDTYWLHNPEWIPLYDKATYIYAVSKAVTRAAQPNSSHVILQSTESTEQIDGQNRTWPFPTPQAKRVEVYYALAGGAKGLSYWWFKPGAPSNGLGAQTPAALTLWKEIGLLGNEIKTVSPLLVVSHPVDLEIEASRGVWARALLSGTDTLILLVVNDDYHNDEAGFHSSPIADATVTVHLPRWMQSVTAFEVSARGVSDVSAAPSDASLKLDLGELTLTRMIVVTADDDLRRAIAQRYDDLVKPGLCAMAPELCR